MLLRQQLWVLMRLQMRLLMRLMRLLMWVLTLARALARHRVDRNLRKNPECATSRSQVVIPVPLLF